VNPKKRSSSNESGTETWISFFPQVLRPFWASSIGFNLVTNTKFLKILFAALFLLVALSPGLTLFSGQVIKQFETYSLAQSMPGVGWNPFETSIPCDGGLRWVLELPIYASLGGVFIALFPNWPSILPTLVFGIFLIALYRLRKALAPETPFLPWLAVAAAPVFMRFSTQFLADPLALALLLFGAGFFLKQDRKVSFLFFLLAVSVKPTVLPSILFFRWAFEPRRKARDLLPERPSQWILREIGIALALVLPFVAWSLAVRSLGILSPLHEGGLLSFGSGWSLLLTRNFYSKFFVWTVFKGIGIPLFLFALYGCFRPSERLLRLAAWSVGIIPYWILIRQLNIVHDYYSLSFFAPLALLGALTAAEMAQAFPKLRIAASIVLGISIAQGVILFVIHSGRTGRVAVENRPIFCGKEMRAEELRGATGLPSQ
jgi:hypothetical protein